jgi:hypothetical protein
MVLVGDEVVDVETPTVEGRGEGSIHGQGPRGSVIEQKRKPSAFSMHRLEVVHVVIGYDGSQLAMQWLGHCEDLSHRSRVGR